MNYDQFEQKVKGMSAHDIIMAMVNGLRQPRTRIDMGTYGKIKEGICYGCAATNTILHIMGSSKDEVEEHIRGRFSDPHSVFPLVLFENAIDCLRRGNVALYNKYASEVGFAQITPMPGQELPRLGNDYTEAQLQEYEKLAKYQLTV